jgi:diaminopimelate epimerase
MKFIKMQATGNDFIVMDARGVERNWSEFAQTACRRHFGVGADGLILLSTSESADFKMRMFNPDGSEAEACGNGIRCFAKYVVESKFTNNAIFEVETLAGVRKAEVEVINGKVVSVRVGMGTPKFNLSEIPVILDKKTPILNYPLKIKGKELKISLVSVGNPHAVLFTEEAVSEFPLSKIGPLVENHSIFPKRTNFEVANVVNRDEIVARVWERGAGETLSCGSGACAITVASMLKGFTNDQVDVRLTGGTLTVEWDGEREVFLSGPAEKIFEGEW